MATTKLNFNTLNILGELNSRWVLSNASISNNVLTIGVGGTATLVLDQTLIQTAYQYNKMSVVFGGDGLDNITNFKSHPKIIINETYKNESNEVSINKTRCIGFNTTNKVSSDPIKYNDVTIYESLNKPMYAFKIMIVNNGDSPLTVYSIILNTSIDISDKQISDVINNVNTANEPATFKVYTNDTYSTLVALGVVLANSSKEFIYKPVKTGNLLSSIETNFGTTYNVIYIAEAPNMGT